MEPSRGTLELKELQSSGGGTQVARIWDMTSNIYTRSANITLVSNVFAFMFTNIGDVIARVNGLIIFPSATPLAALGDSRSIAAHMLDLYKGNLILAFASPTAGVLPQVEIVQLYYAESYKK